MLKNILNLEGVSLLSKVEQKNINGGLSFFGSTCKATCNDGSLVTVSGCSDSSLACSGTAGDSKGCSCDMQVHLINQKDTYLQLINYFKTLINIFIISVLFLFIKNKI